MKDGAQLCWVVPLSQLSQMSLNSLVPVSSVLSAPGEQRLDHFCWLDEWPVPPQPLACGRWLIHICGLVPPEWAAHRSSIRHSSHGMMWVLSGQNCLVSLELWVLPQDRLDVSVLHGWGVCVPSLVLRGLVASVLGNSFPQRHLLTCGQKPQTPCNGISQTPPCLEQSRDKRGIEWCLQDLGPSKCYVLASTDLLCNAMAYLKFMQLLPSIQ